MPAEAFRTGYYARYNARRLEHLASLGLDLCDKSVLEVGAGVGDLTSFFLDRGCKVTSIEARAENIERCAETFRSGEYHPTVSLRLVHADAESLDRNVAEQFDVVFCYGLLYHTADPEAVLRQLAARCSGLLLLETCVSLGDHEAINPIEEDVALASQSYHGGACRPTRPWVLNRLRELFAFTYVPATQPTSAEFLLDWSLPAESLPAEQALTRAVFIGARHALAQPLLLDHLPRHQRRS
jgi:SAM-dependent methyltransferase